MSATIILITFFSEILSLILFVLFCTKKSQLELKIVFAYIIIEFLVDFITTRTAWGIIHLYLLLSIITILEFFCYTFFLYLCIGNKIIKKAMAASSLLFAAYLIMSFLKTEKAHFDGPQAAGESVLIMIFCIIYLYEQISKPQDFFVYSTPNFWIILGVLIYMSGTLFLFIIRDSLGNEDRSRFWLINNLCNIIKNLLFSVAFLVNHYANKRGSLKKSYPNIADNPYENWKP